MVHPSIGPDQSIWVVCLLILFFNLIHGYEVGNIASEFNVEQGQVKYALPVELPRGFPLHLFDLELEYTSGSSNGPLGLGWTINGLSQISRCATTWAQDGYIESVMYDSGDKFCMDGSRLELTAGEYGGDGSTYSTEIDSYSQIYLRPPGLQGFQVRTKNNRIMGYGRGANSHVRMQDNIHAWKLDWVSDYTNNVVNITYVDGSNGHFISNVSYKDILIAFSYENREDVSTSYFNGGVFLTLDKRLGSIRTYVGGKLHRELKITYTDVKASKISTIASIQLCSRNDKCQAPVLFAYQGITDKKNISPPRCWINAFGVSTGGWQNSHHPRFMEDMNGDGLIDVVGFAGAGVMVALNQNESFAPAKYWVNSYGVSSGGWSVAHHPRYLEDVNGDGLPDVVGFASSGVYVSLNTGSESFTGPQLWLAAFGHTAGGWSVDHHPRFVKDVTGDGIPDIVGFASSGVYVSVNQNKPTFVIQIDDSYANRKSITYSSLADEATYTRGETTQYPNPKVNNAQVVVKQIEQSNGVGGINTTQFTYKAFQVNIQGRGKLGFEEQTETMVENEEVFKKVYHQHFPLTSLIKSIEKIVRGKLILQNDKLYNYTGSRIKHIHMTKDLVTHLDLHSEVLRSECLTVDTIDNYGNIVNMTNTIEGNGQIFMQVTVNNYTNNASSWYIGELKGISVTHTSDRSNPITRQSKYYHSPLTRKLVCELREPEHPLGLNTSYVYNIYGNMIAKRESLIISRQQVTSEMTRNVFLDYDKGGSRLLSSRNDYGHKETYTYDAYSNLVTHTGVNDLTTNYAYDEFDRKISETKPDGTVTRWQLKRPIPELFSFDGSSYIENITRTGAQDIIKLFDAFDRPIRVISKGFDHKYIYEDIEYDPFSRVKQQSLPSFNKETKPTWVGFQYDYLGREITEALSVEGIQSSVKRTEYTGFAEKHTDTNGHSKTTTRDASGRIIQVTDALGGSVSFKYNAIGSLVKTIDPAGHITEITYDQLGNKQSITDPDMGRWQYIYNVYSEKLWQKDAVDNEIFYKYDQLGRIIERNDPEGKTTWFYDQGVNGKGKRSKTQSPNGHTTEYMYDMYGREASVIQLIDGEKFEVKSMYNALGKVAKQTMPESKEVYYCYDDAGYLNKVSGSACDETASGSDLVYWQAIDYDEFGHISSEKYGNSLLTMYEFDVSNHLRQIKTWDTAENVKRDWEYDYDQAGNMLSRRDLSGGVGAMETFSYDALDRITRSTIRHVDPAVAGALTEDWEYDSIGNLVRYSGCGGLHYQYSPAQPHTVTKAGPNTYKYDLNGNMIQKNNQNITWNSFNKPKTIDTKYNSHIEFQYNAEHSRIKKNSDTEAVVYIGKLYERVRDKTMEAQTYQNTHKYYIYALGRLVAIDSKLGTGPSAVKYLHGDHLGSIDTITDEKGDILESLRYNAYGQRRLDSWETLNGCGKFAQPGSEYTKRGYTGHEHIEELDLINMNGRIYDPVIGRFLSPDPHIQDPYNTQNYNRYSYTLNNPLKHKDPSGYFFKKIGRFFKKHWRPIVAVAASVVTFGAATPLAAGLVASVGLSGATAAVASGAIAGATAGFVGGTVGSGSVKGGLQGALGGAVSGGIGGYFGSSWNFERVASQAIGGGTTAELSGGDFKDGFLMAGITASSRYLYNSAVEYDSTWKSGGPAQVKYDNTMPIPGANNIGTQGHTTIDPSGWFNEGGVVSRVLNKVPGVNSVAGMHDVFQVKLDRVFFPGARDVFNVPGMIPAAVFSYASLLDGAASQALLVDEKKR